MVGISMTDEATTSGTEQAAGHPQLLSLAGDGDLNAHLGTVAVCREPAVVH